MNCFAGPLSLSLGLVYSCSSECSILIARPLNWCSASASCLAAAWSLITCFNAPLTNLSLGSWSRHLFFSCSSKCSILLDSPLHWYLASVSSLAATWSLLTCFDGPLRLSLGSWSCQLLYFGSTECTSLLAHPRYWCLASVSCVVALGAFCFALLVPWACCLVPACFTGPLLSLSLGSWSRHMVYSCSSKRSILFASLCIGTSRLCHALSPLGV
jgi:hypothetical protein